MKIKRVVGEQMHLVGCEEATNAFDSFAGNILRLSTNIKALLMTNEDGGSFESENDMQLELVRKIVTLLEEILDSLNLVAKVQTSKQNPIDCL